jgi:hypothetical protein
VVFTSPAIWSENSEENHGSEAFWFQVINKCNSWKWQCLVNYISSVCWKCMITFADFLHILKGDVKRTSKPWIITGTIFLSPLLYLYSALPLHLKNHQFELEHLIVWVAGNVSQYYIQWTYEQVMLESPVHKLSYF